MQDKNGREYAKLSNLKAGDVVTIDGGFDCMDSGKPHEVYGNGDLYLICDHGHHFLSGQLEVDNDSLVGVYPA